MAPRRLALARGEARISRHVDFARAARGDVDFRQRGRAALVARTLHAADRAVAGRDERQDEGAGLRPGMIRRQ